MAEFQFIVNGELVTYDSWENIPDEFDHVIKFLPDVPEEADADHDHEELELWNVRLQELMEKERARSNKNR